MSCRIGILGKDTAYIKRLADFLDSHYSDSLTADWSAEGAGGLDFGGVKYDAVLICDDFKSADEKSLSKVKKIYLVSKASEDRQPQILKYQRLEEIYRQIMEICGSRAPEFQNQPQHDETDAETDDMQEEQEDEYVQGRFDELEFSRERIGEKVYSVLDYSAADLGEPNDLEAGMLENNSIQGIAGFSKKKGKLYYEVTGKWPLTYFVTKNDSAEGKAKLIQIFSNIVSAMGSLDEYMLDWQKLIMRADEIFVDRKTLGVSLLYYPFDMEENKERGIYEQLEEIISVCEDLMIAIEDADDEGTNALDELQEAADDSARAKKQTAKLNDAKQTPCLVRKRTNEKIMINRDIFKLGKDTDYVDYCINDNPTVCRYHADVVKKADGYYAVDKGSLNHTFVNGKRLEEKQYVKLADGDLLQIADEVFEFRFV